MTIIGANKRVLTPFGVWVKTTLLVKNLTQKELAKEIGIPTQNITRITYGEVKDSKHVDTIIDILADGDEQETTKARKIFLFEGITSNEKSSAFGK